VVEESACILGRQRKHDEIGAFYVAPGCPFIDFSNFKLLANTSVTVYGKTQPKPFFQMSMFMSFINQYHVQNILCKGHHCALLHFEMLVLEKSDF
jgi:hypothetical protein